MEVRYSINGNYFADFGVFVSASKGIADALKRKKVNSYDWVEYHGLSVDLDKPKYEARTIELQCFITGDNWEILLANFLKLIRDEFYKPGTQRLLIEPFGYKAMPYEVYMQDDVNVSKDFREGKMHAVFSLKMIEPNPIKKVLYFTGDKLELSYNCPTETEIFYGNGLKETAQGNVSLSGKVLADRAVSGYNFDGRNLLNYSQFPTKWNGNDVGRLSQVIFPVNVGGLDAVFLQADQGKNVSVYGYSREVDAGTYTLSAMVHQRSLGYQTVTLKAFDAAAVSKIIFRETWERIEVTFTLAEKRTFFPVIIEIDFNYIEIRELKLEKGSKATDWQRAPEDERYIILAGNVEEITNLQSNATVLWERL